MVGGVKLNLTEFTWFVSFYIFTDHYLFQYSLATYKRQGGRRASMVIENFQCSWIRGIKTQILNRVDEKGDRKQLRNNTNK